MKESRGKGNGDWLLYLLRGHELLIVYSERNKKISHKLCSGRREGNIVMHVTLNQGNVCGNI